MSKIRKLYYFDKKSTQEMISFLNNSANEIYINRIMFNPFLLLHHLIPLRFKFLPEAYVQKEKNDIKGMIMVAPTRCPLKQMEIQKLLFEENCYDVAAELIQYVVSKYKAKGTTSFLVRVDDYLPELIKLFISKCGFTQISYEKLWRINHIEHTDYENYQIRNFRDSDSPSIAALYNDSLLPHFRPLLGKNSIEFKDLFCKGLSYYTEFKYVIEDKNSGGILTYISVQTSDNKNYVIDVVQSSWIELDYKKIISFVNDMISKRQKKFSLFIKTKKYTQNGEPLETYFFNEKYECVQNQIVLTNTSARILKTENNSKKFTVLDRFYGGAENPC